MADRKLIFETLVGSHLYGTTMADSDHDYHGVFLPSTADLLGLEKCPDEIQADEKISDTARNDKDDIDRKWFSLPRFLNLCLQGQPSQLEMLFAPPQVVTISKPEWDMIIRCREAFISKKSIRPFIGFAIAQVHKATIKGENLNQIRALIAACQPDIAADQRILLRNVLTDTAIHGIIVERLKNEFGFDQVCIAGRCFDPGILLKSFIGSLTKLEERYGNRSEKAAAAGVDYKSLMHAWRLIGEARELLQYEYITLPRPDAHHLRMIRQGRDPDPHICDLLQVHLDDIQKVVAPASALPDEPNRKWANEICQHILYEHFFE